MSEIWPAYLRLLCNAVAAGMLLSLLTLDVAHANQTESANSGASEGAAKKDAFETCLTSLAFQTNIPYRTDAKFKESNQKQLNRAQTSIDNGDFNRARKSLQKLEKKELNDFELGLIYYLYGQMASAEENDEDALYQYRRISKLNENNLPVVFEREVDAAVLQLQIQLESVDEIIAAALNWCAKTVTDKETAKALLINLYGQLGAQDHVDALTAIVPSGDALPLVKALPDYPKYAQEKGLSGYCVVEYVVTETGDVRDPVVIEEMCDPKSIFAEPSIEAALKFKYAPHLINGVPVEVKGVQNKFTYELVP